MNATTVVGENTKNLKPQTLNPKPKASAAHPRWWAAPKPLDLNGASRPTQSLLSKATRAVAAAQQSHEGGSSCIKILLAASGCPVKTKVLHQRPGQNSGGRRFSLRANFGTRERLKPPRDLPPSRVLLAFRGLQTSFKPL